MIIDAHTHRYPDEIIADPASFAHRMGEDGWLRMVTPKNRSGLQGWADRNTMLADMDAAGIDQCILLGWYWENHQTCMEANDWHRKWIQEDTDRFVAFLSLRPGIPNLCEYLARAREDGFKGIGESHPWAQGFSMQDKEWMAAMEFASSHGWPVNFHVTDPSGREYPGKVDTPMNDFLWLANELPDLKIILAHAGALYALGNSIPDNFYFDLAACPLLYPPKVYQKLIDCVGAEKILWGTDYPLRIYPASSKKPDFFTFLTQFKNSITAEGDDLANLLGKNVQKLIR